MTDSTIENTTVQERLLDALANGSPTTIEDFVVEDVLYASFEQDEVEYHMQDSIWYDETIVDPERLLDNLWYYVREYTMGHTIRAGSHYYGRARVIEDDLVSLDGTIGDDPERIVVTYQCETHVDTNGAIRDPAVMVLRDPKQ